MSALRAHWQKAKDWWTNLAVREQQAVAIGSALVVLFILYLIWSAVLDHLDDMRKRLDNAQKTLVWMQSADAAIKKIESQSITEKGATTPVELLSYLQAQINKSALTPALKELKQSANDAVEIHFQKVSFDRLIAMLITTVKEQSVYITQMTAVADNTPGIVNADVMLKLG